MYNGITYQTCTDANNNGVLWCATEVDPDMNTWRWGNCGQACNQGMYSLT